MSTDKMTNGEMIAAMGKIRAERKELAARDKELCAQWREVEQALIAYGDEQGVNKMSTTDLTATITEEVVPNPVDWDEIYAHILAEGAMHLLQRRISTAAFRELRDAGQDIPGVEPFTNRKILLRKPPK